MSYTAKSEDDDVAQICAKVFVSAEHSSERLQRRVNALNTPYLPNAKADKLQLGRRTEPRFAKVTTLILLLRAAFSANKNTQHEAPHGLSAIAELLVKLV